MNPVAILLAAFLISLVALGVFIWSMRRGVLDHDAGGARVIFSANEVGRVEDPAAQPGSLAALQNAVDFRAGRAEPISDADLSQRADADRSSATVTFVFLSCAIGWLLLGSFAGLIASIKLHEPDWLTSYEWLTFGRIRTIHLNAVIYGWTPMAGVGLAMWMLPRLLKTTLQGRRFALLGAVLWNAGLIAGVGATAVGLNTGLEWLEMPWQVGLLLVAGGALIGIPLLLTLARRTVGHLYVSIWYLGAALLWFPILFLVANMPGMHSGVEQATMNWWYGHNVLGYFFTPLALGAIYYFLPKVIGRPIQSYNLSLLGFWTHAFFYGQVGGHHLIGGPVPTWLVTLSIVQSVMMIVPVIAFATNQTLTMKGYWGTLLYSPTLRFVVVGAIMYVLVSVQGSLEALRSVNTITHFTHFTVAHAHLGMYAFVSITLFGGIYFVMPRVIEREWPYPHLIAAHFWLVVTGMTVYLVSLTIGGWRQGLAMLDAARPFMDSVAITLPWLEARSVGGALMTAGHVIFAAHFLAMVLMVGPRRDPAALLHLARTTDRA
jgi:cytochrome c oxidase cbb3-type subunit I